MPFVSRSPSSATRGPTPLVDARGAALPSLRDPWVIGLLLLVVLLQSLAWSRIDGYQIADSVEFMERARSFVRGEQMVDVGAIRPFGFSSVLVPFVAIADWFGVPDQRAVVWCMTIIEMAIGLALVFVIVRIGAQLVDRGAGLIAGFAVGTNPVFLQYSAQLVSGVAAGLCIALALQSLLVRGNFRRSLIGGMWLAGALLMHYQTIPIILSIGALVLCRDRFKHPRSIGGILVGVTLGCAIQVTLDKLMFGSFGASLWNYALQNFGSVLVSLFARLGWIELVKPLYAAVHESLGSAPAMPDSVEIRGLQSPWYYLQHLPQMLVWPALAACALGLLRAIVRWRWTTTILLLTLVANVAAQSNKGSKDFRLWLPLLPFIGPLCGYGWSWVASRCDGSRRAWQRALTTAFVVATVFFGLQNLFVMSTRQFGGYWKAIDFVSETVLASCSQRAASPALASRADRPPKVRVGSAYNWCVYMRESALVDLIKLPSHLNLWQKYDAGVRSNDLRVIDSLDIFITHLPILYPINHDLMEHVNAQFEVCAAFYDQQTYENGLGPIFVLRKRTGAPGALTFFDVTEGESPAAYRARLQLPAESHFARVLPENGQRRMVLLGWQYHVLPPEEHGWITYHWYTPTGFDHDYHIIDRITSPDEHNSWQNNHWPAYDLLPTSSWKKGSILSESYLVVAADQPFLAHGAYRPIGGSYRRGDLIPARLWLGLVEYDPADLERGDNTHPRGRMLAAAPVALDPFVPTATFAPPVKLELSEELVLIGAFFLPVQPKARLPDDGRPVPK